MTSSLSQITASVFAETGALSSVRSWQSMRTKRAALSAKGDSRTSLSSWTSGHCGELSAIACATAVAIASRWRPAPLSEALIDRHTLTVLLANCATAPSADAHAPRDAIDDLPMSNTGRLLRPRSGAPATEGVRANVTPLRSGCCDSIPLPSKRQCIARRQTGLFAHWTLLFGCGRTMGAV